MGPVILSFVAGVITSLSPCVLPVLPILFGSAVQKNKLGPIFILSGLVLSFTLFGTFFIFLENFISIDLTVVRKASGALLLLVGVLLVSEKFQGFLQRLINPIANRANQLSVGISMDSFSGQFLVGALLGITWSPCIGPALGIAISFASQAETIHKAIFLILTFSIGTSIPLLAFAYGSGIFLNSKKALLIKTGLKSKAVLGFIVIIISISLITGLDKSFESFVLSHLPATWINFITKF